MTHDRQSPDEIPTTMRAVRLHAPGGVDGLVVEEVETPRVQAGDALVRVHAAALTRDELEWPTDRLPAIPSYELSGVVVEVAPDVDSVAPGTAVFGLTPFDRDGVASEYATVPAELLAPRPDAVGHVEAATVPLPALSAWEALFEHGRLEDGQRVVVHGAGGGVGWFATQLARWAGAHVIATASPATLETARSAGAHEVIDRTAPGLEERFEQVDLVLDTVGGETLAHSAALVRPGGRIVSVAEEPPESTRRAGIEAIYFVVRPDRAQLLELAGLLEARELRTAVDSVFPLGDARAAFERSLASGKRGKVVLRVRDD